MNTFKSYFLSPPPPLFLRKSNIFDNMLAMMEKYANNLEAVVAERTEQLRLEKKMTENLLLRMLPRYVSLLLPFRKKNRSIFDESRYSISGYISLICPS